MLYNDFRDNRFDEFRIGFGLTSLLLSHRSVSTKLLFNFSSKRRELVLVLEITVC